MINNTININNEEVVNEEVVNEEVVNEENRIVKDLKSTNLQIYRFKFTKDFMEELYTFSKIHQYDERNDFKEAWQIWTEDNEEIINSEIKRLNELEYDGDIMDKKEYFDLCIDKLRCPMCRAIY